MWVHNDRSTVLKDQNYKYGTFAFIHLIQISIRLELLACSSSGVNGKLLAYNVEFTFYSIMTRITIVRQRLGKLLAAMNTQATIK